MSCQQITMRKLLNQKYEQYAPHLNPYSNILFCENWSWPQTNILQTLGTKTKQPIPKTSSVKLDITTWFLSLSHNEKCAATMIKNSNFLYSFLEIFHQWNPNLLYHIYQHRKIPNYLSKNLDTETSKYFLQHISIAWLDEPLIYFNVDPLQSEIFFQKFISWMDKVSNNKIFEYAHKLKNKSDPQENLLWFTQKSFQCLEAWITNQYQKVLTKNYYNKNNYDLDNYGKIEKLRSGLSSNWSNSFGCKKQIQTLLATKIVDTKNKNENDFKQYQLKMKVYEDQFYEQVSLLLDFEKTQQNLQNNDDISKKKKKKPKRKNKKKCSDGPNNQEGQKNNQNQDQNEKSDEKIDQQLQANIKKQLNVTLIKCELDQNRKQISSHGKQTQVPCQVSQQKYKTTENKTNQMGHNLQKCQQKGNIQCRNEQNELISPIEDKEKQLSDNSGNSQQWSNVQTTKTTKKSGHSHPQFNQFDRVKDLKNKRSLSPEQNHNSISKKRKIRGQRKNKANAISSWNGDQSINQNFVQSYEVKCISPNKEYNQKQEQTSKNNSSNLQIPLVQKKKKKKLNKSQILLKQLSNKVSSSLLSRQVSNFIDSLSIDTNSLYDHKIVSFQRVRFFIQSLFPTSQAILFGSNAVGLSLPTSDIDIMVFNLPCSCRDEATQILAHLAVQINTMGWIVSCSTYLNAKVPLVKLEIDPTIEYLKTKRKCDYHPGLMMDPRILQHLQLKTKKQFKNNEIINKLNICNIIKVDLTINISQQGFLGGQSTELMKLWMNRYPQIHICILAFKYILSQRQFSSNFKGGIGSYCLFVMVAAYIREHPELEELDDGEFFLSTLKFYGQDFQNQLKSIMLRPFVENQEKSETQTNQSSQKFPNTCFISLQETISLVRHQMSIHYIPEDPAILYTIQTNPLRIFDPINSRIMSGSCHLYPQIKSQFRRIYKEFQHMKEAVEKEVQLTVNITEVPKMLQNKKTMDKWLNKYQIRNRISIKDIFNGGF